MIIDHLPVLLIIIPLISAPICVLLHKESLAWILATFVSWLLLALSFLLLQQVMEVGVIRYAIGGWQVPWGIELYIDKVNAFVLTVVTIISSLTILAARKSVLQEIAFDRIYLFYTAYLLSIAGLIGVVLTGDAFNLFVFIEISSLSSYALISLGRDKRALYAAYRYLILGTVGATFILIGVGLLYAVTGTLNIQDLAQRIPMVESVRTSTTALCFILIGLSIKLALFPLHVWLPDAYTHAPSTVSILLAGTSTKVFIYVLIRCLFQIYGVDTVSTLFNLPTILLLLSLIAVLVGSINAIMQTNVKSLLAHSSIAQIGYMILAISLLNINGLTAGLLHIFNHALIKATLFMAVACLVYRLGSSQIGSLRGIARDMPWTTWAFILAALSLIGVPGTVGFISKWYLLMAALEEKLWVVSAVILIGSLLSIVYMWKVVEVMYFKPVTTADTDNTHRQEAPVSMLIPLWLFVIANIYLGIDTSLTVDNATQAALQIFGM